MSEFTKALDMLRETILVPMAQKLKERGQQIDALEKRVMLLEMAMQPKPRKPRAKKIKDAAGDLSEVVAVPQPASKVSMEDVANVLQAVRMGHRTKDSIADVTGMDDMLVADILAMPPDILKQMETDWNAARERGDV